MGERVNASLNNDAGARQSSQSGQRSVQWLDTSFRQRTIDPGGAIVLEDVARGERTSEGHVIQLSQRVVAVQSRVEVHQSVGDAGRTADVGCASEASRSERTVGVDCSADGRFNVVDFGLQRSSVAASSDRNPSGCRTNIQRVGKVRTVSANASTSGRDEDRTALVCSTQVNWDVSTGVLLYAQVLNF